MCFNLPEIYHGVSQLLDCVFYNLSSLCYPSSIHKLTAVVTILCCVYFNIFSFAFIHLQIFICIGFIISSSYTILYHINF